MLRKDDLENGYQIWQDPELFCFGMDAVLLAHYPALTDGERVMDLCTGFAPVPHILCARARDLGLGISVTGIEINERAARASARSVRENGLEDRITICQGDIREAADRFGAASFSLVTVNPPYMPAGRGRVAQNPEKAAARTELLCTLRDVTRTAAHLLIPGGRFAMVHRPFRLPDIFEEMRAARLEPKRMRLVCPHPGEAPAMVLIEGVKGGGAFLAAEPPLIAANPDGTYTEELLRIYREP